MKIIREAYNSLIVGHFSVSKTVAHLQRYFYWPRMLESVSRFIKGCSLCAVSKPRNRKLRFYTPLLVPSRPWESVSMDFVGGLPLSKRGHDYSYVVVDRVRKVCILMPCKKKITAKQTAQLFFENVWVHFGFPTSILVIEILTLLGIFGQACGD